MVIQRSYMSFNALSCHTTFACENLKLMVALTNMVQVLVGDEGKSRVFRCTMKQNRKPCAVLFEEEEYEQAVIEAYYQSKEKVKLPNNRYPFSCIHCKTSHKDKNTVSYHRMFNLCKVYKGDKPLKMYPTWEPSEHGEKARIAAKYGKVSSPPNSSVASPIDLPPVLDLDAKPSRKRALNRVSAEHSPPPKKRKVSVRVAGQLPVTMPLPTMAKDIMVLPSKFPNNIALSPPVPRRKLKAQKPTFQHTAHGTEERVPIPRSHSEARSSTKEQTMDAAQIPSPMEASAFRVMKHSHVTRSREDVEAAAWRESAQLFGQAIDNGKPPPEVDVNGLYILITETDDKWVPKDLIDDPDACMQYLHEQLEDGSIGQRIGSAFGQWYLYGNTQVCYSHSISMFFFKIVYVLHEYCACYSCYSLSMLFIKFFSSFAEHKDSNGA